MMTEPSDEMMEDARQVRACIEERLARVHLAHELLERGYLDADTLAVFKRDSWLKSVTYCSHPMGDN